MGIGDMSLNEYYTRLSMLSSDLSASVVQSVIIPSSNELLAQIKNRIVLDGKDSNGQKIGNYSTKPGYYTREQFDRKSSFSARGKNGSGNFKNGKQRKSMYLSSGYKGLRDVQGKPSDTVVLNYTGSTMAAYQQGATDKEVVQGMTTKLASDIRRGHEAKRGKPIYRASKKELEDYNKRVAEDFRQLNINIIKGVSK